MMKRFLIPLCLIVGVQAHAKNITLDPSKVLSLQLSNKGINRLTLLNDEIDGVFCAPTHLEELLQLDPSGHLFVIGDEVTQEAYMSLVTASGGVQDFKIVFGARDPEPTFLSVPHQETQKNAAPIELDAPDIVPLLSRVRDGDMSGWRMTRTSMRSRKVGDLTATLDVSYVHERYPLVLHVCALEGQGSLAPSLFQKRGDLALVMTEKSLTPNTKLLILQERK